MRDHRHLYLVQNGRAYRCSRANDGYWVEPAPGGGCVRFWRLGEVYEAELCASLALAADHTEALALARAHDAGRIWPIPTPWEGLIVSALVAPYADTTDSPGQAAAIIIASAVGGLIIAATIAAAVCIALH